MWALKGATSRDSLSGGQLINENRFQCKPFCFASKRGAVVRLYFNNLASKKVAFFDKDKNEEMVAISEIADIRKYADKIKTIIGYYLANA
jgi:hypothetical protein